MSDTRVMTLDLVDAEELLKYVDHDDQLREELCHAIRLAEYGDVCNDVFLFDHVSEFVIPATVNDIPYVLNG